MCYLVSGQNSLYSKYICAKNVVFEKCQNRWESWKSAQIVDISLQYSPPQPKYGTPTL